MGAEVKRMKRMLAVLLVLGFLAFGADGAELYRTYCASCHGEAGEGKHGVYPALDGPVGRLATVPEGRTFLVATVLFGLEGEITQRGETYNGVMPGYGAVLSDEEVAALLNWLLSQWRNPRSGAGAKPFTPEEVARVRELGLEPKEVRELFLKVEEVMHRGQGAGHCQDHGHGQGQGRGKGKGAR